MPVLSKMRSGTFANFAVVALPSMNPFPAPLK
jgi:hypothetical protein